MGGLCHREEGQSNRDSGMKKNSESVETESQKLDREIAASGRIVGFRFDDATAAKLSTILGEEKFQAVREGLERTARILMLPPSESRRDRRQMRVRRDRGLISRELPATGSSIEGYLLYRRQRS